MPNPATHILVPLILADLYRDYIAKKKFPLFYVLVAGIAGLLPDIDIAIWRIIGFFREVSVSSVHRQFTHTIFIPLLFLMAALLMRKNRKAKLLFGMASFGIFTHLVLDAIFSGSIMPFYPFSELSFGLNLALFTGMQPQMLFAVFDGILLGGWLIHEYVKHMIKDFI
ncbi:MAG: metal-dependent hydrolase [Candidatus Nanoarchaeia archaeon]|nr:metal-dependent hydrolase [Candidatus Nanoarchaeia archaeon]